MKTIAKYSLNPLARCFVPLSMKAFSESNDIVSVMNNENKDMHEVFTAVKSKSNAISQFFGATKELKKLPAEVGVIGTEESLVTTEGDLPTEHKLTNGSTVETTPKAINGDEISDEPEERTCIQDMSSTESNTLLSKERLCCKNTKMFETGLRLKLLFPAPRVLEVDWFYETARKNALILYITMMLYSLLSSAPQSRYNKLTYSSSIEEVEEEVEEEFKDDGEECRCPAMFGWIIPHSFFGNPLKLSSTCGKKCAHISYKYESNNLHEESIQTTLENESQLKGETTLDQCSSQLEAIIKDVCDSVDHTLAMTDNENSKSKSQTKVQLNRPVWESAPQKDLDLEIIDDGIHPLLKEVNSEDADSEKLFETQELLTKALSHDAETSDPQSVCVPPCTVWCCNVPPPAKDTYKRFIKKFHSESIHKKGADVNGKAFRKTLFKRCFSADDASTHCDSNKRPLLSPSSFETRERLLLLHKDPVAFIKRSSRIASEEIKLRLDVSEKLSSGCSDESPYYGADSLWQPLPDCFPVSDHIQKHSHRRMRDMRRQKSVP